MWTGGVAVVGAFDVVTLLPVTSVETTLTALNTAVSALIAADESLAATNFQMLPPCATARVPLYLIAAAPGLPESTRHGTTSVVIANCSLGLAFGSQRDGTNDPIVSCYARVENIPKTVLKDCADSITWNNPKAYLDHLEQL